MGNLEYDALKAVVASTPCQVQGEPAEVMASTCSSAPPRTPLMVAVCARPARRRRHPFSVSQERCMTM
jgi:hypothetical protein